MRKDAAETTAECRYPAYRTMLKCNFPQLEDVFDDCMDEAVKSLSEDGIKAYLEGASLVCMIGRGFEPVLVYLEEMPQICRHVGEQAARQIAQSVWKISRTPNGVSILSFLQALPSAARRLQSQQSFDRFIEIVFEFMESTTGSIHGHHTTIPSPGLTELLNSTALLLSQISLEGLKNWVDYGVRYYSDHPERQKDYFSVESADSKAILQRERHGKLFADNQRRLDMYLKSLWNDKQQLVPYSTGFAIDPAAQSKPLPYFDATGMRIPDVLDDSDSGISGLDCYRAMLAHMSAHRRWSEKIIVDNYSPFQRFGIECLEDCRVDTLAIRRFPGLFMLFISLHPQPVEYACDDESESCIRHRLTMLSYACMNRQHRYKNKDIIEFADRFHVILEQGESSLKEMAALAVSFIARTRRQADQNAKIHFTDTEISYRDDNRHLWIYIEESDDEEMFNREEQKLIDDETNQLPPRHYAEWDYRVKNYRPDWVSLYENLHPPGSAKKIDSLLKKHAALAKRLQQLLELLKPQNYVRVRYQEEGSELDLDIAVRSLIDYKSGITPDPRINMSHKHDGRNIAVTLLLDLSASLDDIPAGCSQTILELSQEAVALLSMAIDELGDPFAIAGFSSNTRHLVRYQHIKGFNEKWDDEVKSRLAAIKAGYSTRMGAAIRHAGHYLGHQPTDKKLLLVLTDGEPSDVDADDAYLLIADTAKAVKELDQDGIYTHCINLDPDADEYVQDIFGTRYTVIDKVESLPEKLPQLFMSLTK
ncbi:MAG: VWA domain-containing protein [Gammaproteobacteria bacterium]|nr:VWA domain-containing protein [Gammaproteobacteria bacterium]